MRVIRNFDLPFILPGEAQYDPQEIADSDIVKAYYRRVEGHVGCPNICAMPGSDPYGKLSDVCSVADYDRNKILSLTKSERLEKLMGIKDMIRIPLPFHLTVDSAINGNLIRSYANRELGIYDTGKTEKMTVCGREIKNSVISRKNDLMSTPPAFSIIGTAGTGKTTAVTLSIRKYPKAILHELGEISYIQIPIVMLTAPANSNLKALFIQFGQRIDDILGGTYYSELFSKQSHNLGRLANMMTEVIKKLSIGIIIIDEIQMMDFKPGSAKSFENFISIMANSGVALCCVGTPDAMDRIGADLRIYRRLAENVIRTDDYCADTAYVKQITRLVWNIQFADKPVSLTEGTLDFIADLSGGSINSIIDICIAIQRQAIILNDPGIMDTAYLQDFLSTNENIKIRSMIMASRKKNAGICEYKKSMSEALSKPENDKVSKLLAPNVYTEISEKAEVRQSIMNVLEGYTEMEIDMAYDAAAATEGFKEMTTPLKTKTVIGLLSEIKKSGKKKIGKKPAAKKVPRLSNEALIEDIMKVAGGA